MKYFTKKAVDIAATRRLLVEIKRRGITLDRTGRSTNPADARWIPGKKGDKGDLIKLPKGLASPRAQLFHEFGHHLDRASQTPKKLRASSEYLNASTRGRGAERALWKMERADLANEALADRQALRVIDEWGKKSGNKMDYIRMRDRGVESYITPAGDRTGRDLGELRRLYDRIRNLAF